MLVPKGAWSYSPAMGVYAVHSIVMIFPYNIYLLGI